MKNTTQNEETRNDLDKAFKSTEKAFTNKNNRTLVGCGGDTLFIQNFLDDRGNYNQIYVGLGSISFTKYRNYASAANVVVKGKNEKDAHKIKMFCKVLIDSMDFDIANLEM